MKKILTGVKPTEMPHLGNYKGAIEPAITASQSKENLGLYFVADYHSLVGVHKGEKLRQDIYEVAAAWIACGLDTDQNILYQQSQIPEIPELAWILSCFTPKGLMNRAHAYKAKVQANEEAGKDKDSDVSMGLYNYPILMAADILFIGADFVPVGSDQLQHIEIARDVAATFNHTYGDILTLPEPLIAQDSVLVPGLDGRKMSKSYGNHIPLFLPEKKLRKMIMKIVTDSRPPQEPKEPEGFLFDLFKLFASEDEVSSLAAHYRSGIAWGEAKQILFEKINEDLAPKREIYDSLMADKSKIDKILSEGRDKIRPQAQDLLLKVKRAVGVTS